MASRVDCGKRFGLGGDLGGDRSVSTPVAVRYFCQPVDRIVPLPLGRLVGRAVAGRVVGVGVRLHPVGEALDHGRSAAGARPLDRRGDHANIAAASLPST